MHAVVCVLLHGSGDSRYLPVLHLLLVALWPCSAALVDCDDHTACLLLTLAQLLAELLCLAQQYSSSLLHGIAQSSGGLLLYFFELC